MTFIREIHMPASCRGFVLEDSNGDYNIYINQDLSPEAKLRTLRHEQTHIRMGGSKRPLVDGKTDEELTEFITTSLKKRESYYQKAADTITIPTITRQEEIDECVEVLKKIIINRVSQQKQ